MTTTDPPAEAGGSDSGSKQQDPTFTQADLNRIAAREKDEGKRAAMAEVASKLGCTVEEAIELVKTARAKEDAEKSEAQKAKEAADRAAADAEKAKAEAAREKHLARVERALIKAGVDEKKLDKVARMLDAEVGAEMDAIEAATKDLKKDFPELFNGRKGPIDSDTGGGSPKPTIKDDDYSSGVERAKRYSQSVLGIKQEVK